MIDPSMLRELIESVEIPGPYRGRVESYGPDAARSLIRFYDTLKELLDNAGPGEGSS